MSSADDNSTTIVTVIQFVNVHANILTEIILYMVVALLVLICALLGKRTRWGCLFALSMLMVPIIVRSVSNLGEVACLESTLCVDEQFAFRTLFSLILFLEMTLKLYRWSDQVPGGRELADDAWRTVVTPRAIYKALAVFAGTLVVQIAALVWVYLTHSATLASVQMGLCGLVFGLALIGVQMQINKAMHKIGGNCAQTVYRRRRLSGAMLSLLCLAALFDTLASLVGAATSISSNAAVEILHRIAVIFILGATACTAGNRETVQRVDGPDEDDPQGRFFQLTDAGGEDDKQRVLSATHQRVEQQQQQHANDDSTIVAINMVEKKAVDVKNINMTRSFVQLGLWWSTFSLGECQEALSGVSATQPRVLYQNLTAMSKVIDTTGSNTQAMLGQVASALRRMSYDELKEVQHLLVNNALRRHDAAIRELIRIFLFHSVYCGHPVSESTVRALTGYLSSTPQQPSASTAAAGEEDNILKTALKLLAASAQLSVPPYDKSFYTKCLQSSKQSFFTGNHHESERKFSSAGARMHWLLGENEDSATSELKLEMEGVQAVLRCTDVMTAVQVSDRLALDQAGVKSVTDQLAEALQTLAPYYQLVLCSDFHTTVPIHALVSWYTSNSDAVLRIHQRAFKKAGIKSTPPVPADVTTAAAAAAVESKQEQVVFSSIEEDGNFSIGSAAADGLQIDDDGEEDGEAAKMRRTTKEEAKKVDNAVRHLLVVCILAIRTSNQIPWMNVFVHSAMSRIHNLRAKILILNDYYRANASDFLLSSELSSPSVSEPARQLLAGAWADFRPGLFDLEAAVQERVASIIAADVFQSVYDAVNKDLRQRLSWLPMDTFIRVEHKEVFLVNVLDVQLTSKSDTDRRSWLAFATLLLVGFFGEAEYGIKLSVSLRRWLKGETKKFLAGLCMSAAAASAKTGAVVDFSNLVHRCVSIPLHVCNPFSA